MFRLSFPHFQAPYCIYVEVVEVEDVQRAKLPPRIPETEAEVLPFLVFFNSFRHTKSFARRWVPILPVIKISGDWAINLRQSWGTNLRI